MSSMSSMPFGVSAFTMPMDPNIIHTMQSDILHSVFGMPSSQSSNETSNEFQNQPIFEQEIFNSIQNLFGIPSPDIGRNVDSPVQTPRQKKMTIKEYPVMITLEECYSCGTKRIVIERNIRNQTHKEILELDIPMGVSNHSSKIFIEKGDVTEDCSIAGDLHIAFTIEKHPHFKKYGQDIIYEKKILLSEALYGCSFVITLPNHAHLKFISSDIIEPNMTKTFEGLGFPNASNENGDLHILFIIEFPKQLVNKQRELLYKLLPKRKKNSQLETVQIDKQFII